MLSSSVRDHGANVLHLAKLKADESRKNREHAEAKEKRKRADAVDQQILLLEQRNDNSSFDYHALNPELTLRPIMLSQHRLRKLKKTLREKKCNWSTLRFQRPPKTIVHRRTSNK